MNRWYERVLLAIATVSLVAACATMQDRWEAAKAADTIAAYEEFLQGYPEGDRANMARERRGELQEERDWKEAEAKNSVQAYEDFRKNHPRGRHKDEVYARLEMLAPPRVTDLPLLSTEKFLKRYQQGIFMDEELRRQETLAFEQAVTGNTVSSYEDFLRRYPAGRLAPEARRRMEKLAFEQARAAGTISMYEGYLNRYPDGVFAEEARLRRERLKAAGPAVGWGKIMYPKPGTQLRARRSTASPSKGQLKPDQPVRADFLRDNWYAIFSLTQKKRNEGLALGYVYAPLLAAQRWVVSSASPASAGESAPDAPPKGRGTEDLPVHVKSVAFKAARDGKEVLFIEFDRFYTPAISGIEGAEPRIILEIQNAAPLNEEWAVIDTGGDCIRRIRSSRDAQTHAALITLEMAPGKAYLVTPAFYQQENMYVMAISEQKEQQRPRAAAGDAGPPPEAEAAAGP